MPIKIVTDLSDPEKFGSNYKIYFYPTFVFLDTEGNEKIRFCGAPENPQEFIESLSKTIPEENSWANHKKKYEQDPSTAEAYHTLLKDAHLEEEATELYFKMFMDKSMEERFNAENLAYYSRFFWDFEHPIIKFMMENETEVDKVLGDGKCRAFLGHKADARYTRINKAKTIEDFNACLVLGDNNELLRTNLYYFIKGNAADIFNQENGHDVIKDAYKYTKLGDATLNYYLFMYSKMAANLNDAETTLPNKTKKIWLKCMDEMIKVEKIKPRIKWFEDMKVRFSK